MSENKQTVLTYLVVLLTFNSAVCQINTAVKNREQLNYPFNTAAKIEIASFQNLEPLNDTLSTGRCNELPTANGKIDFTKFNKVKDVEAKKFDQLEKILFPNNFNAAIDYNTETDCRDSGYAILFLNEKGDVFEYIVFCFACNSIDTSFKNIRLNDENIFWNLKKFFDKNGLVIRIYRDE
jgi:hypothetical protein